MSQSALPNIKLSLPNNRIKSSLTQLSDFFSEFAPLSPAVQHDRWNYFNSRTVIEEFLSLLRPERSLHMRLYSLDKRSFVLVFLAFFACFTLSIFIGLAGPEITLTREIDAASLTNSSQENYLANGPFIIQTQLLGSYSRTCWLFAKYKIENTESKRAWTSNTQNNFLFFQTRTLTLLLTWMYK